MMSWLSDIKQEAETQRQSDAAVAEAPADAHLETVQPQLHMFKEFLTDLAEQLQVLDREIIHTYDVLGHVRLTELRQGGYHVESDGDGHLIRKITLRYECVGTSTMQFWVENRDECNTVKEQLDAHSMVFRFKDDANWRYIFTLQPLVKVVFTFEPHPTESGIRLVAKNFERLGVTSYSFAADNVNDALLNEFGKKLVKESNNFEEMSGYRVAQDVRKQFQEKIAARQKERETELQATTPPKAAGRLGRLFKKSAPATDTPAEAPPRQATPAKPKPNVADTAKTPVYAKKYAGMVTDSTANGEDTYELASILGPGMEGHAGIKNLMQFQKNIAARQKEHEAEPQATTPPMAAGGLGRLFKKSAPATDTPAEAPPRQATPAKLKPNVADTAKKYAWMVTGSTASGEDTTELVNRLGPGMGYHAGIKNLISKGTHFRMLDAAGEVQYTGYLVGECTGREPLEEYGSERDCKTIQVELDGKWITR
jgi:hypothetical protein